MRLKIIKNDILPKRHVFAKVDQLHALNFEALCIFAATGFFMDDDTYWKDTVCIKPGHSYTLDASGFVVKAEPWFNWYHNPQSLSFEETLEQYVELLTTIVSEQTQGNSVILPLSGGLDSRSQAKVLKDIGAKVQAFSYEFDGGYPETKIAATIAEACGFDFTKFTITQGYLWDSIKTLTTLNGCYSEFTHPRQLAVLQDLKQMNGIFSLGHWGDVLFDRGVPEGTTESNLVTVLLKKMLKPGGLELAEALWRSWNLDGNFKDYLVSRVEDALSKLSIENISAKARAFKTTQWAHRWTTTNLSVFAAAHPVTLPYYDNRMCQFICEVPEVYLADRRLQLAHLRQDPALSKITWQAQTPYNLINYESNRMPYNLPYRVYNKIKREFKALLGHLYIQRNYELQFLGTDNDNHLQSYLFSNDFYSFVPKEVIDTFYRKFKTEDTVGYSHPVSMLLTLALWNQTTNTPESK